MFSRIMPPSEIRLLQAIFGKERLIEDCQATFEQAEKAVWKVWKALVIGRVSYTTYLEARMRLQNIVTNLANLSGREVKRHYHSADDLYMIAENVIEANAFVEAAIYELSESKPLQA